METNAENLETTQLRLPKFVALTLALAFACWFAIAVYANRSGSGAGAHGITATPTSTIQLPVHSGCLIEFTDGNDDNYMILDTHNNEGEVNRLHRNTGLGDSNTDSIFVTMDVD